MGPVEQLLREAWAVIEDPNKRCIGYYAVDARGYGIETTSKQACKWCSLGAIYKVAKNNALLYNGGIKYLVVAAKNLNNPSVMDFSDSDIRNNPPKLYAEAIRLAEKDGV